MSRLRTLLILFLCALLPLTAMSGCGRTAIGEAPTIALMPLDSRPCNTQYPALLAEAATATIALPPDNILDEFLTPADTDALWTWLEEQAETADHLIIFTNSLFCGGLIASRESGAYDQNAENLERLEALCNSFKAREDAGSITVVQVLPRLSPNQFDDALFPYYDALTDYGEAWDAADQAGEAAPEAADGVPADALAEYQRLHKESAALAKSLDALTAEGLIDQLLVSQDDGAEYCPANITFRSLADHAENTQLIYGADELSMLLVANLSAAGLDASPVRIVYSDDADRSRIYPYEAASLEEMTAQKLTLGGATAGDDADATLYIHTDSSDASTTLSAVSDHDGLFALADVAQTNQADPALADALLSPETASALDAYAGWNTAGNTIGTTIATLRAMDTLDARWDDLSADARKTPSAPSMRSAPSASQKTSATWLRSAQTCSSNSPSQTSRTTPPPSQTAPPGKKPTPSSNRPTPHTTPSSPPCSTAHTPFASPTTPSPCRSQTSQARPPSHGHAASKCASTWKWT